MRVVLLTVVYVLLYIATSWTADLNINRARFLQTGVDKNHSSTGLFYEYKAIFNKSYTTDFEERIRKTIFKENIEYIRHHNIQYTKGHKSYTLAVNEFSDLSHKEFVEFYTRGINISLPTINITLFKHKSERSLPKTIDWRSQGYVTGVKTQGKCGACWAFTTTGTLEGQLFAKTGRLVSLSEQQLVDCDKMNGGCQNGYVEFAMLYIREAGGLVGETNYPYMAEQTECHYDTRNIVPGSGVIGYWTVIPGDEQDLQQGVADAGPVAAAIDASHKSFQHYSTGVYDEPDCSQYDLTHGVLVVGYGSNPTDFWLVKNSWGLSWGEAGYARMARNKKNQCGIASQAVYPVL